MNTGTDRLATPARFLMLMLAAAMVASLALLWLVTASPVLVAAFGGGLAVIVAALLIHARMRPASEVEEVAPPDWSVTIAALEHAGDAIAITDRANRLTCANAQFVSGDLPKPGVGPDGMVYVIYLDGDDIMLDKYFPSKSKI